MPTGYKIVFGTDMIARKGDEFARRLAAIIGSEYTNDVKMRMRNSPRGGENINSRGQQRSAPGEPPAPDTGDLIRETRFVVRKTSLGWLVEAGNTLKKALYLEYGAAKVTNTGAEWILFPRPVWGPAFQALRRRMPELIRRASDSSGRRR